MITSDMLAPITSTVTSSITAVGPVGIGILALMLGFKVVPRVIKSFF